MTKLRASSRLVQRVRFLSLGRSCLSEWGRVYGQNIYDLGRGIRAVDYLLSRKESGIQAGLEFNRQRSGGGTPDSLL